MDGRRRPRRDPPRAGAGRASPASGGPSPPDRRRRRSRRRPGPATAARIAPPSDRRPELLRTLSYPPSSRRFMVSSARLRLNIEPPSIRAAVPLLLGSPSAAPRPSRSRLPRLAHDLAEVLEHAETPALALLGVELGGVEAAARDCRRECEP